MKYIGYLTISACLLGGILGSRSAGRHPNSGSISTAPVLPKSAVDPPEAGGGQPTIAGHDPVKSPKPIDKPLIHVH